MISWHRFLPSFVKRGVFGGGLKLSQNGVYGGIQKNQWNGERCKKWEGGLKKGWEIFWGKIVKKKLWKDGKVKYFPNFEKILLRSTN